MLMQENERNKSSSIRKKLIGGRGLYYKDRFRLVESEYAYESMYDNWGQSEWHIYKKKSKCHSMFFVINVQAQAHDSSAIVISPTPDPLPLLARRCALARVRALVARGYKGLGFSDSCELSKWTLSF